jgi:hypothetical protein
MDALKFVSHAIVFLKQARVIRAEMIQSQLDILRQVRG